MQLFRFAYGDSYWQTFLLSRHYLYVWFFPLIKLLAVFCFYEYEIKSLPNWIPIPTTYILLEAIACLILHNKKAFDSKTEEKKKKIKAYVLLYFIVFAVSSLIIYISAKAINYFNKDKEAQ